jgi:DNA-binding transcriptional MerR regulator
MAAELISESIVKARKKHKDDTYRELIQHWKDLDLTIAELRTIVKMRRNNGCIMPGEMYSRATCKQDGELFTFKSKQEMLAIALKHDLWDD